MAIYISGVKGLPEQVQENKENIKTIQEEIEGIDFDHIRELDDQVAENTGDINNLEGAIGVQNIAIESINDTIDDNLKPRIQTLEDKTQKISYDSVNSRTLIDGELEVVGSRVYTNNIADTNNYGAIYIPEQADESVLVINNSGGSIHALTFTKDGELLIDGNPVGKTYYRHNIYLNGTTTSPSRYYWIIFNIINTDPTPINTMASLYTYLSARYPTYNKSLQATGYLKEGTNNYTIIYCYKGGSSNTLAVSYINETAGNINSFEYISNITTLNDNVETL